MDRRRWAGIAGSLGTICVMFMLLPRVNNESNPEWVPMILYAVIAVAFVSLVLRVLRVQDSWMYRRVTYILSRILFGVVWIFFIGLLVTALGSMIGDSSIDIAYKMLLGGLCLLMVLFSAAIFMRRRR